MTHKKKPIEVARPLEAIDKASAPDKWVRHGHPSTLNLWWAMRPLAAAARAVNCSQMAHDPATCVDTLPGDPSTRRWAERERKKRHAAWAERKAPYRQAQAAGDATVPEPG